MTILELAEADDSAPEDQLWLSKNVSRMTWFRAFRSDFGYSSYGEYRTSVTIDIPLAAIIYACVLVSIAALVAAAGIRGRQRWYTLIRVSYSLAVGSIIAVSLFGYCWQSGDVTVHAPYIYRSQGKMEGSLGIRIGVNTVNITLIGTFNADGSTFKYNEEFTLEEVLKERERLWKALDRGLPQPLLSVLDFFYVDDAGLRFGRDVWYAGYLANILLCVSFAFWLAGNVLLCSVIWYGAVCFTLSGAAMVTTSVTYHLLSPQYDIRMPCGEKDMRLTYGWCFWSVLVFGVLTTLIGLLLFLLERKVPEKLAEFFVIEKSLEEMDEYRQTNGDGRWTPDRRDSPQIAWRGTNSERRDSPGTKNPVNWHVNYGYDPQRQTDNPVYRDNDNADGDIGQRHPDSSRLTVGTSGLTEGSKVASDDFRRASDSDSGRCRSFSSIAEEEESPGTPDKARVRRAGQAAGRPASPADRNYSSAQELHNQTVDRLSSIYVDVEGHVTQELGGVKL